MATTRFSVEDKFYEDLGLTPEASLEEIKSAYRKLALKYHPDRVTQDKKAESEEKFKKFSSSYEVLSNPDTKVAYDRFLNAIPFTAIYTSNADEIKFEYNTTLEQLKITVRRSGFEIKLQDLKLLNKSPCGKHTCLIYALAWQLKPEVFCSMIEVIPPEKRAHYLFYPFEVKLHLSKLSPTKPKYDPLEEKKYCTAYEIYKYHLRELYESVSPNQFVKQVSEGIERLEQLINPVKPELKEKFQETKKQVTAEIRNYSACWKMSIFGHHHEGRATHVLSLIEKTNNLDEILLIIDNQLELLENKVNLPAFKVKFEQYTQHKITNITFDELERWYNSRPVNLPNQDSLKSSGYYRALIAAKEILQDSPEKASGPSL